MAVAAAALVTAGPMAGQSRPLPRATLDTLALLLEREDTRVFDATLFGRALASRSALVRRTAVRAAGRVGGPGATPLLRAHLADADTAVAADAAFFLGLSRDTAAIVPLALRLGHGADAGGAVEPVAALARIGGIGVALMFGEVLLGEVAESWIPARREMALQAWRLGAEAPAGALVAAVADPDPEVRWRAVYSLARLRSRLGVRALLGASTDADARVRAFAVRGLSRALADSAQVPRDSAVAALVARLADPEPGVRINALAILATHGTAAPAPAVLPLLEAPEVNVRVQAAATLGALGDRGAAAPLVRLLEQPIPFALRREAILAVARLDPPGFRERHRAWSEDADWRIRAVAAQAWAIAGDGGGGRPDFLADADGRVIAAALEAEAARDRSPQSPLVGRARGLLAHPDPVVRGSAAGIVARAASPDDVPALVGLWQMAQRDSITDAGLGALAALKAVWAAVGGRERVEREFLAAAARPDDAQYRRWAEQEWPELATRWGPVAPIATGRTRADYFRLAAQYLAGTPRERHPHVRVETEGAGAIALELLGPDAPVTVDNFLRLAGQGYFDGVRWHRVVPNFVVQDGDPRGDGNGGPGWAIRDELNRHRYATGVVGMALSGPDTGGSQWFITVSPQPHLDGGYTIFGRVVGDPAPLWRIAQGDRLVSVRAQQP